MRKIRVGSLSDFPPGKGKVVEVQGREVSVYNVHGKYSAVTSKRARDHLAIAPGCAAHGRPFDVFSEDSPADQLADDREVRVLVEAQAVWLEIS